MSLSAVDGVLLVDKAEGMTSHDVVALVRRQLGIKKVGHCGTLDPIATGLLLLTIGRGTKVQDLLMSEDKEYVGTLKLGTTTSTQDREGEVLDVRERPRSTRIGRERPIDDRARHRVQGGSATGRREQFHDVATGHVFEHVDAPGAGGDAAGRRDGSVASQQIRGL